MKFHKEGYSTILIVLSVLVLLNIATFFIGNIYVFYFILAISAVIAYIILQFFRNPTRDRVINENALISPADGTVVVIEKTKETEYFNDERLKVSIFMSVWNVHINRYPISGIIKYTKHHHGKFLFAINPKSSEENERSTIVVERKDKKEILFRQIAGVMARRIVFYAKEGLQVKQSDDCGFIKFGSRVDIYLPIDAKIKVKLGDKVTGTQDVIAEF